MEFYRVNPSAITADQRYANETYTSQRQIAVDEATARQANLDATAKAARAQLVGQYNALFNAGQTAEANAVYEKITALDAQYRDASVQNIFTARTALLELDNNFKAARLVLAGSAAAAQLEYQNNPAGAAQMLSYVYGQPIQLQPVDDGTDLLRPVEQRPERRIGVRLRQFLVDVTRERVAAQPEHDAVVGDAGQVVPGDLHRIGTPGLEPQFGDASVVGVQAVQFFGAAHLIKVQVRQQQDQRRPFPGLRWCRRQPLRRLQRGTFG
jgi:hypothetical protein